MLTSWKETQEGIFLPGEVKFLERYFIVFSIFFLLYFFFNYYLFKLKLFRLNHFCFLAVLIFPSQKPKVFQLKFRSWFKLHISGFPTFYFRCWSKFKLDSYFLFFTKTPQILYVIDYVYLEKLRETKNDKAYYNTNLII